MVEEKLILTVEKFASGGDGIAFLGGQAIFIPLTIPGETVSCTIIERSKDYARARLLDIIDPSPFRVEPECPIFGQCGGCGLQHIAYERQRALKAEAARESFIRTAKFDPGEIPLKAGRPYGYRNRAQFHFTADHGIGFMEAESASSVRARGCPVMVGPIDAWLRRQNKKSRPDKELQAAIGMRDRFVVFGQDDRIYIEGVDARAKATVAGQEYMFPLRHFFQSNLEMAGTLVNDATGGLEGRVAADLYSGAGLFAARLAAQFDEVLCVESDTVSLEAARTNLPKGKARFYPMNVEDWAKAEAARARHGDSPRIDWVVADPPRAGLSPAIRDWLKKAGLGGLVYVSCDHVTMARDIGDLRSSGWHMESLCLYDFYPQTGRVEAVARLIPPSDGRRTV